jgi:hypothetical protein
MLYIASNTTTLFHNAIMLLFHQQGYWEHQPGSGAWWMQSLTGCITAVNFGGKIFTMMRQLSEISTLSLGWEAAMSSSISAFCGKLLSFRKAQTFGTKCLWKQFQNSPYSSMILSDCNNVEECSVLWHPPSDHAFWLFQLLHISGCDF